MNGRGVQPGFHHRFQGLFAAHAAINQYRATVGSEVNNIAAGTAEESAELHRYAAFPSRKQLWPQNVVVEPSVFYHE